MVFTAGSFMLSLALLFISPFSIVITSLGDERAGLCASPTCDYLFCTR